MLLFPGFEYDVFESDGARIPSSLYADVGREEPAYVLASRSSELALKVALYTIGRDRALWPADTGHPKSLLEEAADLVYADCQMRARGEAKSQGHWHRDIILLEPNATIQGSRKPGSDYVAGIYFQKVEGLEWRRGKWKIENAQNEGKLWVPPTGIVVPTRYGTNNSFGLPDATVGFEDEEMAIEMLREAGLPRSELSRFHRKRSGVRAVNSASYSHAGALSISLSSEPNDWIRHLGSLPAEELYSPEEVPTRTVTWL